MHDYVGAFHIHTDYSFDGTTGIKEVIAAARRAGLNFIVVTDHFRMDARKDGWEGWHDGVFVMVGEEISPRYSHYLALGIETPVIAWQKKSRPQEYIDAVNAQGGVGLIAHPDHTGAPKFGVKDYPWKDWSAKGYVGLSVWDLMTDWQEKLTSVPAAVKAYISPAAALTGPKAVTLSRWDELNRTGRVAGYGEIDNHNTSKRMFGLEFRIFPFDLAFKTIRTHILLDEPLSGIKEGAANQIKNAVKASRMYIAQEYWNSSKGFEFRIYNADGTAGPGQDLELKGAPAVAEVKLPREGLIRLIYDGRPAAETSGSRMQFDVSLPGTYRAEAYQKVRGSLRPWIFTNHLRVKA
jgi:hypothetical protein